MRYSFTVIFSALALFVLSCTGASRVKDKPAVKKTPRTTAKTKPAIPHTVGGFGGKKTRSVEARYRALAAKNLCPKGFPQLQGAWRFVGQTKTPDYRETLTVTGTRFVNKLSGRPDGKALAATIRGEVRCLFKNRVLVMTQSVKPEGAFSNRSGDVYPCDVLSRGKGEDKRLLLVCFFDWSKVYPAAGLDFEYQRVKP
mgnify:CR=1 FL=1